MTRAMFTIAFLCGTAAATPPPVTFVLPAKAETITANIAGQSQGWLWAN
jgi:hypothetical protein